MKATSNVHEPAAPAILLHRISQLVTMAGGEEARRGPAMREIGLIRNGAVLISGGQIVAAGAQSEILRHPWVRRHRRELIELDCRGKLVLPGFVDSHTHPAFTAPRLIDFEKRAAGASYAEIAAAGGGIRASLTGVRSSSEAKLADHILGALHQAQAQGTTTVEAKSGYGLDAASELKSLRAIRSAAQQWPGTVVATFLGAHVPPPEFREKPDAYVDLLCREMLPRISRGGLARYVDVFCEQGAFTLAQTLRILAEAAKHKLRTRVHVGQLSNTPLETILAARPVSLDHLDELRREDIRALAASDAIATLLPGANYFLATKKYPPARKLIDIGAAVALATDYNPGTAPTISMPMILSLATTQMKMTVEEALVAATINGACALELGARKGSVTAGKDADLAFFELDDYRELPYWFGANHCVATMMAGRFADLG
ncbi:MAG: imidazolonepropionase [Acidobacteriota bacterium]|nr:imidazolonepropionase [Acidobacteriota bacterium]